MTFLHNQTNGINIKNQGITAAIKMIKAATLSENTRPILCQASAIGSNTPLSTTEAFARKSISTLTFSVFGNTVSNFEICLNGYSLFESLSYTSIFISVTY